MVIWLWPWTHGPLSQFWPNWIAWLSLLLLWITLKRDESTYRAVVGAWLVSALASAVIALVQYLDFDEYFYPFIATSIPGYAYANTRQPNHLATLLTIGMLALAWFRQTGYLKKHIFWMGGLLALGLATTASRGGALQLLAIGLLVIYWDRKKWRPALMWWTLLALVYFLGTVTLPILLETIQGTSNGRSMLSRWSVEGTCSSRKVLWSNMLDIILQKPFFGWGWENIAFASYDTLHAGGRFCTYVTNAHNLPLHLAATLGVPVALAVSIAGVAAFVKYKPWETVDHNRQLAYGVMTVILIHSMLEYPLWFGNFQSALLLSIWMVNSPNSSRPKDPVDTFKVVKKKKGAGIYIATLLGLVILIFSAFDYVRVTQLYLPQEERLEIYKNDTLNKVKNSVFYKDQVLFAQVATAVPDVENAMVLLKAAESALHISPEPRIIERLIVSASLLGRQDIVDYHKIRYEENWPEEYAAWIKSQNQPAPSHAGRDASR